MGLYGLVLVRIGSYASYGVIWMNQRLYGVVYIDRVTYCIIESSKTPPTQNNDKQMKTLEQFNSA